MSDNQDWSRDGSEDSLETMFDEKAEHLADDGFIARVISALPPPQRQQWDWLLPLVMGGAVVFGIFLSPGVLSAVEGQLHDLVQLLTGPTELLALMAAATALGMGELVDREE